MNEIIEQSPIETILQSIQATAQQQKEAGETLNDLYLRDKMQSILNDVVVLRIAIISGSISAELKGYKDAMAKANDIVNNIHNEQ